MGLSLPVETLRLGLWLGLEIIVSMCKEFSSAVCKQKFLKMCYILIMIYASLLGLLFRFVLSDLLISWRDYLHCSSFLTEGLNCWDVSVIYRVYFTLFAIHLLMFLACYQRNQCSVLFNEELWVNKIVFFTLVFLALFYVPNSFFQVYSSLAQIIAIGFILFEIVMIIDIFYLWGELWMEKYELNHLYGFWLILTTVVLYVCTIIWNIYLFNWFTEESSLNSTLIIINLVLIVFSSLLSISGIARNGSLLTSSAVALYSTFLIWTGLANSPEESNGLFKSHSPLNVESVFGFLIITISLMYVSYNRHYFGEREGEGVDREKLGESLVVDVTDLQKYGENLTLYKETNIYLYFHLIMMLGSFFLAMLFTNWGAPELNKKIVFSYDPNILKFWIQIVSSWSLTGLYIWTLIAPKILTNRDFD